MNKIEIKGPSETLERISIFLNNNHIKHDVVGNEQISQGLCEIEESIEWPLW